MTDSKFLLDLLPALGALQPWLAALVLIGVFVVMIAGSPGSKTVPPAPQRRRRPKSKTKRRKTTRSGKRRR